MTLEIVFWDVQHGSSTYIKTPNHTDIVQDLGIGSYSKDKNFSPLVHLKNKYDVDFLDLLIITHPHKDHIEDIKNIHLLQPKALSRIKKISKHDLDVDEDDDDWELFEKYFDLSKDYNQPLSQIDDPRLPENNGGVKIKIFHPEDQNSLNINGNSSVTIISYANIKITLPGDNDSSSWNELLKQEEFLEEIKGTDVLLAPHHGRESGYYPDLFKHFKPKLTVISDGRDKGTSAINKYSSISEGWRVNPGQIDDRIRYCLSTRNDGVISLKLGFDSKDPFLEVNTTK